jgi:hypothetical protein
MAGPHATSKKAICCVPNAVGGLLDSTISLIEVQLARITMRFSTLETLNGRFPKSRSRLTAEKAEFAPQLLVELLELPEISIIWRAMRTSELNCRVSGALAL